MKLQLWINWNVTLPILQGKPKPVVSWLKDGQSIDPKRVNIRNSDKDSILFIRSSQREDSGVYEITVKVDSLEDKATITLQIVGEPQTLSQAWKVGGGGDGGACWLFYRPCDWDAWFTV